MKILFLKALDRVLGALLARLWPRIRKQPEDGQGVSRVLLIRPGGIGDAVLLVPTLYAIHEAFPAAEIDVLAERRNAGVLALCRIHIKVFRYDRLRELVEVFRCRYDLVIDTEQWHRLSAVIARLIRSDRKIGFATNERVRLFTDSVDYSHDDYEVLSFLRLLQPLLLDIGNAYPNPFLHLPCGVKSADELIGGSSGAYVVLFPGASIVERRWGEKRFAQLAERIVATGCAVVIVGGKDDASVAEQLQLRVPAVINLVGKTSLSETASLLRDAAVLVSGDSGVLHIAVGLGTPTVSLFGPGIARKWAPGGSRHVVINHQLLCSPCTKFGYTPKCQIGARCIQGITVDEVFSAVQSQLRSGGEDGIG